MPVKAPDVVDCEVTFVANFVRAEDGGALTGGELHVLKEESYPDKNYLIAGATCASLDAQGSLTLCVSDSKWGYRLVRSPDRSPTILEIDSRLARISRPLRVGLERSATLVLHIVERSPSQTEPLAILFECDAQPLLAREQRAHTVIERATLHWSVPVDRSAESRLDGLPVRVPIELSVLRGPSTVYLHPEALILDPGEVRELTLDVGTLTNLTVSVFDERGAPSGTELGVARSRLDGNGRQERALVYAGEEPQFERKGSTDAHGQWVCADLPPGIWWVGLVPTREPWDEFDAHALAPVAQRIEILANEAQRELTLQTTRGLYLRGRIETPDGRLFAPGAQRGATPNVVLIAHSVELGSTLTGQPELDGNFAIGPLLEGEYVIETFARNYAPIEPLHVRTGGGPIVIRMQIGASLSGHVVDAATGAGVQCEFVMTPLASNKPELLGSTDGQGTFGFSGLAPGEYVVSAFAQDGRTGMSAPQRVGSGDVISDFKLRLEPIESCGQVRIVLEGAIAPGRITLWQDGVCRSLLFVEGAMVHTIAAPPGDLEARLFAGQELVERRALNVARGATTELRIRR